MINLTEMAYPSSFSMEELKTISSYAKRVAYTAERLERISSGSARVVFKIDEEKALKVAKNQKGLAQNQTEADYSIQQMYPDLVAQVFETDEDGVFIEMELAQKVSEKIFKQLLGFSVGDLTRVLGAEAYRIHGAREVSSFWQNEDGGLEHLYENEWVKELIELAINFDHPMPGDFGKVSSYGMVTRDSQPSIVLIDFGFSRSVYKDHYQR